MILGGDVGGTKVHLALFENKETLSIVHEKKFASHEFPNFFSLLKRFIADFPDMELEKVCLGIAGPVYNGRCKATNLPWVIDAENLSRELSVSSVYLINDLEANAWGLRCLHPDEFFVLNAGEEEEGNAALISAGTGLGEAGLCWDGKKHLPFACEGGHVDLAIRNEDEIDLWRYLQNKFHNHISYERILSGAGIFQLYRFLVDTKRAQENPDVEKIDEKLEPQRVIIEKAMKKECPTCIRAIELFVSIYGSEAGNLALKMLSVGGLYIGGGIAPRILDFLKTGSFMKAFTAKGRFTFLLEKIPVKVVLNDNTALFGAARYAYEKR